MRKPMPENTDAARGVRNTHEGRVAVVAGAARGLGAVPLAGSEALPLLESA
jgi:hypothetical protein